MKLWSITKDGEDIIGATRSSQNPAGKATKTCGHVRWGLRGAGSESDKYDLIISRRWDHVQYNGWRNEYGFVVKVINIIYEKESFQQAVLEEITIWVTHEGRDNSIGASELLQQDHQWVTGCWREDRRGGQGVNTSQFASESYDDIVIATLYKKEILILKEATTTLLSNEIKKGQIKMSKKVKFWWSLEANEEEEEKSGFIVGMLLLSQ